MSINVYEALNQERKYIKAKRRVAAYCRVSTDNEDQANSFESQQRYFRQYIERNPDWELYEIFADATVIIGLKQNPTIGRRFSPIFSFIGHLSGKYGRCYT